MSEFRSKIKSRPERTVDICLDPATYAEWEAAEQELVQAKQRTTYVNGDPAVPALAQKVADLESEMADSTVSFRFRALSRRDWADLVAKHPPQQDNPVDKMFGYAVEEALYQAAKLCLVDPELDEDDWRALDDNLSAGQWELVKNTVLAVNAGKVEVPFSRVASRLTADSGETSRQQPSSASASEGSTAGSRRKSPNTSTTKKAD